MRWLTRWQQLRTRWWISWPIDIAIMLAIFWGVSSWQSRDLLPTTGHVPAPAFELVSLTGETYRLPEIQAESTVLYFFAPWCRICHLSISNLEKLRQVRSKKALSILIIALDWQDAAEIKAFVEEHQLTIPVLLGTPEVARAYRIKGFPTYYVLDAAGYVIKHSMGYSTELGLRLRT